MFTDLHKKIVVITGGCGLLGKTFVKTVLDNNAIVIAAAFTRSAENTDSEGPLTRRPRGDHECG